MTIRIVRKVYLLKDATDEEMSCGQSEDNEGEKKCEVDSTGKEVGTGTLKFGYIDHNFYAVVSMWIM